MRTSLIATAIVLSTGLSGCIVGNNAPVEYDGNWTGSWTVDDDSTSGPLSMSLHHAGNHVSGSVSVGGTLCIGDADLDADVVAGGLSGSFTNHIGGDVDIDGDIDAKGEFSGTFRVTSGFCTGTRGTFFLDH